MSNYIEEIQVIFRDVLENEEITINNETCAEDIEEWDSLNHIYLIVEIENNFDIKFTSNQIQEWENVGDMIKLIKTIK